VRPGGSAGRWYKALLWRRARAVLCSWRYPAVRAANASVLPRLVVRAESFAIGPVQGGGRLGGNLGAQPWFCWEAGGKTATERATGIWQQLLADFRPPPTAEGMEERLAPYIEAATARGGAKPAE